MSLTFNVDLSRRGVCPIDVWRKAGIAAGVLLKRLRDDQRVQLAAGDDLNVWAVFQLLSLTKPPKGDQKMKHIFLYSFIGEYCRSNRLVETKEHSGQVREKNVEECKAKKLKQYLGFKYLPELCSIHHLNMERRWT